MLDQFLTYFRRFYPFINSGLIAVLALTCATVANGYVGNKIDREIISLRQKNARGASAPDTEQDNKSKRNRRKRQPKSSEEMQQYIAAIAKRNLFDAVTATPKAAMTDVTAEMADLSTLNVKLLGTFVAIPEEYSWAIIEDKKAKNTDVYSVGAKLLASATILKINRNEVIIDNNGKTEVIYVFGDQDKKKPRESSGDKKPGDGDLEVSKVDDDTYEIAREVFDGLQDNMTQLMTQARIVPYFQKGKINGYKIFAIKKKSFYKNLGLKNGDIIQRVNGMDISSPEKALQMMQQLKSETSFQIDLTRKGQQRTFTYSVR
jgi:general secretion pathway protein C